MHVEYLSNHPRDRLNELLDEQAEQRAFRYRRLQRRDELQRELQLAADRKSMLKRLFTIETQDELELERRMGEIEATVRELDAEIDRLKSRIEAQRAVVHGEESFVSSLQLLCPDDDVTLLCGYRNAGGELDGVLVAPEGVWAIEVKNQPVELTVDGATWTVDRIDQWSTAKETTAAADSKGRSWAQQVLEPSRDLRRWLAGNDLDTPIRTAVMLVHERGKVAGVSDAEVDLVSTRPEALVETMRAEPAELTGDRCRAVITSIKRHHRHHAKNLDHPDADDSVVLGADPVSRGVQRVSRAPGSEPR